MQAQATGVPPPGSRYGTAASAAIVYHRRSISRITACLPASSVWRCLALRRLFDYLPPHGATAGLVAAGMRLRVPFGRREVIGVLVELSDQSEVPLRKLRPAIELLDSTPPRRPPCSSSACGPPSTTSTVWATPLSWALPVLLRQGEPAEACLQRYWRSGGRRQSDDPRLSRAPRQRETLKIIAQHAHGLPHALLANCS